MPDRDDLPPLAALHAFHLAAQTLSFKQAAATLGLTPSAVSHRIRGLEQALGTPLFHRRTRALELTPAGAEYRKAVDRLFTGLRTETGKIRHTAANMPLRLSVLPLFASAVLIPRLPSFRKMFPDIDITLDTRSTVVDLQTDEIDIGIRNMTVPPTGAGAVKLLDTRPMVLCAPSLAPHITSIEDLSRHTLIHCAPRPRAWPDWLERQGFAGFTAADDLWMDTIPAGLEAALQGQGIVLTMAPIARMTMAGAGLVEPFATDGRGGTSYYLVHRPEDAADTRVKAFRDWIAGEMADIKNRRLPGPLAGLAAE